jgi:hypothetical protein
VAAQTPPVARSTFVTVLAWIFIVLAGFATLISILQNIMVSMVFPMAEIQAHAQDRPDMPWFATFMFSHVQLFFLLFLVVSASTLGAAIGLLKRKNWARILFVALMCLGIAWNAAGLVLMFFFYSSFPIGPAGANAPAAAQQFDVMLKVMFGFNVLLVAGFIWLFGWIVKRLVSEDIRREFLPG